MKATSPVFRERKSERAFPESMTTSLILGVAAGSVATKKEGLAGAVALISLSDDYRSRLDYCATELSYCFSPRSPNQSIQRNASAAPFLFATSLYAGSAASFTKARIYFVPWDVMTTTAMRPNEVRAAPTISIMLSDKKEIAEFVALLPMAQMTKDLDYAVYDVRLVVELEGPDQKRTFIASRLAISDEDSPETNTRIDEHFRTKIESWLRKRANQALQHNDHDCHGLCGRTLRASHGRG